jgi:hypothetical protein
VKRVPVAVLVAVAAALLPSGPAGAEAGKDDELELLSLVNNDRAAAGVAPLRMDGRLQNDARTWSEHIKAVAFEHDPNMPWYDCSLRSENVAYGQRTVAQVHREFMNSSGHRANILRANVNVVGFGVSYDSSGGMHTVERFYNCSSVTPPQSTSGAIKAKWLSLGGAPTLGRYQGTPAGICGGGQYQVFGGGTDTGLPSSAIYVHPSVDSGRAHVTFGAFWEHWSNWGYQCGPLKYPTSDPFSINYCRAPAQPSIQVFQGGMIQWSAGTGAHVLVPGPIYSRYAAINGHCGVAGLAVTDPFDWPGAETTWEAQMFEFGYIAAYKSTGQTFFCTYQGACK